MEMEEKVTVVLEFTWKTIRGGNTSDTSTPTTGGLLYDLPIPESHLPVFFVGVNCFHLSGRDHRKNGAFEENDVNINMKVVA